MLVRRHDAHPLWTRIALCGLLVALLPAVLGVPHLDIHGPLHHLGVMDPFCGGTRSVYLTLHGHLRDAVRHNPAGPILVVAALALVLRAAIGWSSRRGGCARATAIAHSGGGGDGCRPRIESAAARGVVDATVGRGVMGAR